METKFRITYTDGRVVESIAKPKDFVAFERQYGTSLAGLGDEKNPPPLEYVFYLAWSPLHRTGSEPRAFDEFLDAIEDVESVEEKPAAVPFTPTPSVEPSPGWPSELG